MCNIVVFGPAHTGKSTLIGYLWAQTITRAELEKKWTEICTIKGQTYVNRYKYACLVDEGKLEGISNRYTNQGSSLIMHLRGINSDNINFLFVDTPGSDHSARERIRGLSYGDMGIFYIEIGKVMECIASSDTKIIDGYLFELKKWAMFRDRNKLIVVISKMDERDYSEESYQKASQYLGSIINDSCIPIIPGAILCKDETDFNIIENRFVKWYKGKTLLTLLKEMILYSSQNSLRISFTPLYISCNEVFPNPDKSGPKIRGKIWSGIMNKETPLRLLPIYVGNEYTSQIVRVKSMKSISDDKALSCAGKDDIVGIGLTDSGVGVSDFIVSRGNMKKESQKRNIRKKNSTLCIINAEQSYVMGTLIRLSFKRKDSDQAFTLMKSQNIIWFGKVLHLSIISIYEHYESDDIHIIMESKVPMVLPVVNNEYIFTNFLLVDENYRNTVSAKIEKLGYPNEMLFRFDLNKIENVSAEIVLRQKLNECISKIDSAATIENIGCGCYLYKNQSSAIDIIKIVKSQFSSLINKQQLDWKIKIDSKICNAEK